MRSAKYLRFAISLLLAAIITVLFSNYGNKKVHPDLNGLMVEAFLKQNNKGEFSLNYFKKYLFYFETGVTLKGQAIVKDGLFSDGDVAASGFGLKLSEEGSATMTVKQWISDGGFSADVPEVPASLRHFYDPTKPAGERYLTDIANARIMGTLQKYVLSNPHMDGVEWALGKPNDHATGVQDHQFTWERGKLWMQMALKETNQVKKDEFMAKAWRSLGETLHMISDNGCPPHVRNDAHPSPLMTNNTWFGNPDPYEEFVDVIRTRQPEQFLAFAKGSPDPGLKSRFTAMHRAEEIADSLAVFTNTNFVTSETISGIDKNGNPWKQVTHPENAYRAPLLQNMTYNDADNSYSTSGGIKQCTDHYYFAEVIPQMCDPYVDMECVKSQAVVLIPNLIEAGKNVIKLFIPKLSVQIVSLEKDVLKGEIKHKTDEEYPTEMKYTGEVMLIIKDKNNRELDKIVTNAKNGIFEETGVKLAKEEKLLARIAFGGISVESEEFVGGSDNVFGIYQGSYTIQINEANLLQARLDQIGPQSAEMRQITEGVTRSSVNNFIADVKWIKGGAQGGAIVKFEIGKPKMMESTFDMTGLRFYVYNLSNTAFIPKFLTPMKDKSNAGTTLKCLPNGFHIVTQKENETITINAVFKGNELVGEWTNSYKGKILWSATFSSRKIMDF